MLHLLVTFESGLTNSFLVRHLDSTSVVGGRIEYIDVLGELRELKNVRSLALSAPPSATPATAAATEHAGSKAPAES